MVPQQNFKEYKKKKERKRKNLLRQAEDTELISDIIYNLVVTVRARQQLRCAIHKHHSGRKF